VVVFAGALLVLFVSCWMPANQIHSFGSQRFFMVATAVITPYSFGVLVGVSAVYHSRRRRRFIGIASVCAAAALLVMILISGPGTIFSPHARGIETYIGAAVVGVWIFLPLLGLVFGSSAVAVSRRKDAPGTTV